MWLKDIGKGFMIEKEHLIVQLVILGSALKDGKLVNIDIIGKVEFCMKIRPHKNSRLTDCGGLIP
jgi:hypothetical protein